MGSDGANWPSEFGDLKRLDVILKCSICYDYLKTCMMTSCGHNFCSLCIRKFMQYKHQCPTCYEETFETGLRNNRPIDEIVHIFTGVKDKLVRSLQVASVAVNGGNLSQLSDLSTEKVIEESESVLVSQSLEDQRPIIKVPKMFSSPKSNVKPPQINDAYATCPVCSVSVPARNINLHLDACLERSNSQVKPQAKPKSKRSPLPKRLYTLMSDKELRKYLKEYNLCTQGDRRTLIARLQRFTVLYNSNNDTEKPRDVMELVKQVEKEERNEKPAPIVKSMQMRICLDRRANFEAVEKANMEYLKEHKESFQKLIEQMRAKGPTKSASTVPRCISPSFVPPEEDDLSQPSTSGLGRVFPDHSPDHTEPHCSNNDDSDDDIFDDKMEQKTHFKATTPRKPLKGCLKKRPKEDLEEKGC